MTVRWVVGLVVVLHGCIHLLGAAKGLGWAKVTQLAEPIGAGLGAVWLAAAAVTIAAGVLLLARVRWWWLVGAVAVVVSQVVIVTSWADAKAGTIANVVLLGAVVYEWASQSSRGARYSRARSPVRIVVFAVLIVVETATVIVAIRIATGSWVDGATAGAISGGLTAATYPALVRRRKRKSRSTNGIG